MANPFLVKFMKQIMMEWSLGENLPFDRVLFQVLQENRAGANERRLCTDTLYKLIRYLPLFILLPLKPEDPEWGRKLTAAIQESETLSIEVLNEKHLKAKPTFESNPRKHLEKVHGVPDDILRSMTEAQLLPLHEALHSLMTEAPLCIRHNTLIKESQSLFEDRILSLGATPSKWIRHSYNFQKRTSLLRNPMYLDGLFEIQDEHSQLVSLCLGAQPGHKVLDLCAGAGGKTLHLSALMEGRGEIWATDISAQKIENLRTRSRRAMANNIRTFEINTTPQIKFDRVLVDAPCSSLGTLRRNPDRLYKISAKEMASILLTQKELLVKGLSLLKPGGHLVYSTCSILPAENQEQISKLVSLNPRMRVKSVPLALKSSQDFLDGDNFLSPSNQSPVYKLAAASPSFNENHLSLGPSQTSGGLTGDGFFISLVELT